MRKTTYLLTALLAVLFLSQAVQAQTVKYYKFTNATPTAEETYSPQINDLSENGGNGVAVTLDSLNRPVKIETYKGGQNTWTETRTYDDGSTLFNRAEHFKPNGESAYSEIITRDAQGRKTRVDWYAPSGALEAVYVYTQQGNGYDYEYLTPDGTSKYVRTYRFDDQGNMILKTYESGATRTESILDPKTSKVITMTQYENGKFSTIAKFTYDANGQVTKKEMFTDQAMTEYFGINEYENDRRTYEWYQYDANTTREYYYTYDSNFTMTELRLHVNGALAVRFVYERTPSGTVLRTLAYDGGGNLFAEYPDRIVKYVKRDGNPKDGKAVVFHRSFRMD